MCNSSRRTLRRRGATGFVLALVALIPLAAALLSGCSAADESEKTNQALAEVAEADRQYSLGHIDQARSWVQKAVALSNAIDVYGGNDSMGERGVIDVLSSHGDYYELATILKPAVANRSLSQIQMLLYEKYADALYRLGQRSQSQAVFTTVLGLLRKRYATPGLLEPGGQPALLDIADAEQQSGDVSDAARDYDSVRRLYPDYAADAANNQAYLCAVEGVDLPNDLKLAQMAVAKSTADNSDLLPLAQDTLGWVYYETWTKTHEKSDLDQAITYLERAVSEVPEMGDCVYHLARAYEASGRVNDARIEYERLANLWPADSQAQADAARIGPPPPSVPDDDRIAPETSV